MKKKLIFLGLVAVLCCLMAVAVSATTIYKNESGTELFRCEIADSYHIDSYEILNGGFDKYDSDGNALTWYLDSTTTENGNTIKVVKAVKTSEVYANGVYSGVDKYKVVSACFDKGTTVVPAFGQYSWGYSIEILFVYVPDEVKEAPDRFLQNTPAIVCEFSENSQCEKFGILTFWGAKSLRFFLMPEKVVTFPTKDGNAFENCIRLEEIKFQDDTTLETLPSWYFGGTGIKRMTVPDSVTYLNSRAFQGMTKLEYVNMGRNVTHMYKNSNNHSLFHDCHSLKTVIFPPKLTAENMIDNYGGGFDYCFGSGDPTFVITGSVEEFLKIKEIICKASNNSKIANATVENGKIVTADYCETFFGGHKMSENATMQFVSYFESITFESACTNDGCTYAGIDESKTIGAIFTWKGFSVSRFADASGCYSVTQSFLVNSEAANAYAKIKNDFAFGVVASVDKEKPLKLESGKVMAESNVIFASIGKNTDSMIEVANNYFDIKVTGIDENNLGMQIAFNGYVVDSGKIYYLHGEEVSEAAVGSSYNDIL